MELSGALELEFRLHSERCQNAQHKISRNVLSIAVEDRGHASARGMSEPCHVCMSQSLLGYNLDDLVVQVTAEFDFHSVGWRQTQYFREFAGIASNNSSNFSHRASPEVSSALKQSHAVESFESSFQRHERSESNPPILCNRTGDTHRIDL